MPKEPPKVWEPWELVKACNRCNRVRGAKDFVCECGCPEFRAPLRREVAEEYLKRTEAAANDIE